MFQDESVQRKSIAWKIVGCYFEAVNHMQHLIVAAGELKAMASKVEAAGEMGGRMNTLPYRKGKVGLVVYHR